MDVLAFGSSSAMSSCLVRICVSISSAVTTCLFSHRRPASSGINSISRISISCSRAKSAKSMISSSLTPRITTAFTFTGFSPTSRSVSIASMTETIEVCDRVIASFRCGCNVSRLTVTRFNPYSFHRSAHCFRTREPFVVSAISFNPIFPIS